jgi:hypothetical protein
MGFHQVFLVEHRSPSVLHGFDKTTAASEIRLHETCKIQFNMNILEAFFQLVLSQGATAERKMAVMVLELAFCTTFERR